MPQESTLRILVIIPAHDEESAIGHVIRDIPAEVVDEVVVVDNASNDQTAQVARVSGATVVQESRMGYGFACQRGLEYAERSGADVIVFLDGDYSDHPEEMPRLLEPILSGDCDMVIGSRTLGKRERGALMPHAVIGNRLACTLMRLFWGARYTDLGPFRAIRYDQLKELEMTDTTYGWTIEMQIKAVRQGLRYREVPVSYRRRIGKSKISGSISGSIRASIWILWTIARHGLSSA